MMFIVFIPIILTFMIQEEKLLYSFDDSTQVEEWRIINDGVMGGISESVVSWSNNGWLIFTGNVSLENNGGFASTRTLPRNYLISGYEGIVVRLRGDGKTYQFRLKTDSSFDGINYKQDFHTNDGEWEEVRFSFSAFKPVYRGRILSDRSPLLPEQIKQLGFLISNKQEGDFRMEVDWIKAY